MRTIIQIGLLITLLSACQNKSGQVTLKPATMGDFWQLNTPQSSLSFVTTKNKVIAEEHSLKFTHGQIKNHQFDASIDLNSINTQIDIRDQRMREILFQTETYPLAIISSQLPTSLSTEQTVELPFILNLHGQQKTYTSKVLIQMAGDQLVVINFDPILVNAKDFAMDGAINQLTKIAGLQAINYEVLVDFKLTFEK